MDKNTNKGLRKSGMRYIVRIHLSLVVAAAIFFTCAGRIDMPRAWAFFAAGFIYYPTSTLFVYKKNPELINERGEKKEGTKTWDTVLMPVYFIVGYYVLAGVVGLDVGRFFWSHLGIPFFVGGFLLYAAGGILNTWAMVKNPHFESTVRIQKERDHAVVTSGPYQIVRHPGYLAGILWTVSVPFIIGSQVGLLPAGVAIFLLVLRTWLEDNTLLKELDGYSVYAKKVKYRLFPGIW